ncbi:hypothetical protein IKQ21_02020 [bacterium]|nr:hypothetical protein [bacterium]
MAGVNINTVNMYKVANVTKTDIPDKPVQNSEEKQTPAFRAHAYTTPVTMRTSLANKDEKKKYNTLIEELDRDYQKKLEFALKSGNLLKNNSNDKSTVLDNLYKIATEDRDPGLDKVTILQECLDIITNPYVITQTCEDIPSEYQKQIIGLITGLSTDPKVINKTKWELNNMHTGTCPAASIEFDLATKHTAEFFRLVEGLTSPKNEVSKKIKMNSLSEKSSDAIWLLNTFKTPHKMNGFDEAEIVLKPDENAIIRARIQNQHKDKGERSIIDVLMQSTFMQLGSQQTYNSLTDKRAPNEWTQENGGLIDFEKTYVESVVEDKNTTSVTYQNVNEEGKLIGYTKDFGTIKKELLETLKLGHNIIIGYTWPDPENDGRLAGHEITIVGYKVKPNGEGVFICQDSDDDKSSPIEMTESFLLPKIHHAGLPDSIASKDFKFKDSWEYGVDDFQNLKKDKETNP